jgi:hypothetical protein
MWNGIFIEGMVIQVIVHGDDDYFSFIFFLKSSCQCSNNDSLAVSSGNLDDIIPFDNIGDVKCILNNLFLPRIKSDGCHGGVIT